jgi:hypothetical protein
MGLSLWFFGSARVRHVVILSALSPVIARLGAAGEQSPLKELFFFDDLFPD